MLFTCVRRMKAHCKVWTKNSTKKYILWVYLIWQVSNPTGQSQQPYILSQYVHKGKNAGLLYEHHLCVISWFKVSSQQIIVKCIGLDLNDVMYWIPNVCPVFRLTVSSTAGLVRNSDPHCNYCCKYPTTLLITDSD